MDEEELTFSKFLSSYSQMLPFGNMRPLDNKKTIVANDYIFYVSTMRPLQICWKTYFTICLLVAGCKGLIMLMDVTLGSADIIIKRN